MEKAKFYKYEVNLLSTIAFYLSSSNSLSISYAILEEAFPILLLIKRQMLELSHPYMYPI